MMTRPRKNTDDEIYIYINENDELLQWNWDKEELGIDPVEIQYCCIAFCAFLFVFFII